MKKLFTITFTALFIMTSFCSCGSNDKTENGTNDTQNNNVTEGTPRDEAIRDEEVRDEVDMTDDNMIDDAEDAIDDTTGAIEEGMDDALTDDKKDNTNK